MDPKEINEISLRLTQQWKELIKPRLTKKQGQSQLFLKHLETQGQIAFKYENTKLLGKAMDIIPIQRLYEEAELKDEGSLEDNVIRRLLHWFKTEFFTWVNNAPCDYCHSDKTKSIGYTQPTLDELRYDAHAVETYLCSTCNAVTRFPRYGDPEKLLETRRGRCGEWANCFTLCCRAVGAEARIVYDTTDHVWTEVYSEQEQRWIHCDSCEEAWDRPLLYSVGWNKELNYCTAFSVYEAVDVTKRYTRNWAQVLQRRNKVTEVELALFLDELTIRRQQHLEQIEKNLLNERKVKELIQLEEESKKKLVKDDELAGRQSGSLAWRTSRGETDTANTMIDLNMSGNLKLYPLSTQNSIEKLILLGSASLQQDNSQSSLPIIRITKSIPDQIGAVYNRQTIQLNDSLKGIEVEFAFRITDGNGLPEKNGADGFAFIIQAQGENALGEGGCQLGYGGIKNSFAVEFDTYQSADRCADPSGNHISVQARPVPFVNSAHHDASLGHTSYIPSLQNGKWMKSKIRLLDSGDIEIGLGEYNDKVYIKVLTVRNQNFKKYFCSELKQAWIGFTASTGGLSQNHDIQFISIKEYRTT
ncbi:hypothetical protein BDF21DRAFT_464092 [Thamnidium elegans]|nr:hypothetical protein BDF21DRAFT_464092 [Thamnidium elegans]